ncbi:MAG: hypothetical protein RMM53_01010 [Bacteroidia bacterium]|nr:hypothetical protein [Bacteroidia bacterium]MDW8332774.1 hypothetical protein [Bacteroidia bacterium]
MNVAWNENDKRTLWIIASALGWLSLTGACVWGLPFLWGVRDQTPQARTFARRGENPRYTNPWAEQNVRVESVKGRAHYLFDYRFLDADDRPQRSRWYHDRRFIDSLSAAFGVPPSMYEAYFPTPAELAKRKKLMDAGLFSMRGNVLGPDYKRIVALHKIVGKGPYLTMQKQLKARAVELEGHDPDKPYFASPSEELIWALRFCQDIPYQIPPLIHEGRYTNELWPPSALLTEAYGDCDSKSLLCAAILANNPRHRVVVVETPGHMLIGVRGVPNPYQLSIRYRNESYILCEPVGMARLDPGEPSDWVRNSSTILGVYPVTF